MVMMISTFSTQAYQAPTTNPPPRQSNRALPIPGQMSLRLQLFEQISQFLIQRFQEECNGYLSLFKQIVVDEKKIPYEKRVSNCKEILSNISKSIKKISKEIPHYNSEDVVKILSDAKLELNRLSKEKEDSEVDSLELFMRDLSSKLQKANILRPELNLYNIYKNQKIPEGYGSQPYLTALEKREAQDQHEAAINDAMKKANHKLRELEEQEK
jgi:hypothetical protein